MNDTNSDNPPFDPELLDLNVEGAEYDFEDAEDPDVFEREQVRGALPSPGDPRRLSRAVDWRGRHVYGTQRTQQTAEYGRFLHGMPAGLCLHFPVGNGWSKKHVKKEPAAVALAKGVDIQMQTAIYLGRILRKAGYHNTYYIIDYLGRHHQDCNVDDRGIHGHSANRYTQGVEIAGAGLLSAVDGEFYRSFDVKHPFEPSHKRVLKQPGRPSYPAWARRTITERDDNIHTGTYALFTPGQIEGIFRLHADLIGLDAGRGVYRSLHDPNRSGVTSHDVHCDRKTDVGGSLFCNIRTLGEVLDEYVRRLLTLAGGDYGAICEAPAHAAAYGETVLARADYQAVYAGWQDTLPIWA
jgi:hypothetical protein